MKHLLIFQFDLHHRLYNNVLKGFLDEETNSRLYGNTSINHVKYLAGHLLNAQYGLGRIAGIDPQIKWNDLFAVMNHSKAIDDFEYPDIDEIKTEWNGMHQDIRNSLTKLSPEALNAVPSAPFDRIAPSVGQLWAFINHHQAYHIGQVGILRRGFGKEPMSYQ